MNPMTDVVREYYDSQEWKYDFDGEKNIFFHADEPEGCGVLPGDHPLQR